MYLLLKKPIDSEQLSEASDVSRHEQTQGEIEADENDIEQDRDGNFQKLDIVREKEFYDEIINDEQNIESAEFQDPAYEHFRSFEISFYDRIEAEKEDIDQRDRFLRKQEKRENGRRKIQSEGIYSAEFDDDNDGEKGSQRRHRHIEQIEKRAGIHDRDAQCAHDGAERDFLCVFHISSSGSGLRRDIRSSSRRTSERSRCRIMSNRRRSFVSGSRRKRSRCGGYC